MLSDRTYPPLPEWLVILFEAMLVLFVAGVIEVKVDATTKAALIAGSCLLFVFLSYFVLQNLGRFFDFFVPLVVLTGHLLWDKIMEWRKEAHATHHKNKPGIAGTSAASLLLLFLLPLMLAPPPARAAAGPVAAQLENSPPPPPKQKRKTYPVNPDEKSATRSPVNSEEPRVAIYVLASGSKPLPGAVVQLFTGGNECGRSISDKNGKTVFDRLEPGNYVIKIARRDYEPRTQSLTIGDRPPDPIKIVLSKASGAP